MRGLTTEFVTDGGIVRAVDGVSFQVRKGPTMSTESLTALPANIRASRR